MKGKRDYINIPIALMVLAFQRKIINPFRTFIYLKTICDGHFIYDSNFIQIHSGILKIHPKTFRNHTAKLVKMGWITINGISMSFRLVGFEQLARKYHLLSPKGAIFYFTDIEKFKGFCIAAVTKYLILWVRRGRIRSGLKRESPRKYRNCPSYPYLPIAYLSKVLLLSQSTIFSYYRLAEKAGYLKSTPQFQETTIPVKQSDIFKKHGTNTPEVVRKSSKTLFIQKPSKLEVDIYLRRKGNLRKICSKNYKEKKRTYKRE